jgi:hypothetical protein
LYSSDNSTEKNISQKLPIDYEQLKIGFVDTQSDNTPRITIIDDIKFARKSNDQIKLDSYSVISNEDGTYNLDFTVKENTDVDFVYNEETNTYEVHLKEGKGGNINFSQSLDREKGERLKIDFLNYSSKNESAKTEDPKPIRKPIIIIDDGEED